MIPPRYQDQAWDDEHATEPFAPDFESRKKAFFEQVLRNPAPPRGSKRAMIEVARLAAGGAPEEKVIHEALTDFIEGRKDCADFVMQAVIRILYQFGGRRDAARRESDSSRQPSSGRGRCSALCFSQELLDHAKAATLGFKYWPDEPGIDSMCTWTENHQILFSTAAYLAGQLYPQEIFANTGRTGREMMAIHRPRIDRWLAMRFQSGFSEWLSNVYYDEDWAALINLVDFADDDELRKRACMILDLSLFDMALNSFRGVFGSTHGRSYEQNKKWAALEGTTDTAKLLFGSGAFSAYDNISATLFALSENYHMPQVLFEIAHDDAVMENRQRMGHRVEDAEQWGLSYDDAESGMVFLSNEAYLHPKTIELTVEMFDAFQWWENDFFSPFRPYRRFLHVLKRLKLLPLMARLFQRDLCRNMRDEANIYIYRTPDYMLSSAQDYRAGFGGDQHHIWQATLGPNAVCFTTHPVWQTEGTPNYWTGSGTLPRVAQVENVVIAVYKINKMPALYVPNNLFYTHAWLPKKEFDEVIEKDDWIFARKGDGYLALRSQKPYHWVSDLSFSRKEIGEVVSAAKSGASADEASEQNADEIIAEGEKNIWICELGRKEEDGAFSEFIEKISQAEIHFRGLSVRYKSPSQGWLTFGWRGPFKKSGKEISLNNYPRYDNPSCQAEFWPERIHIGHRDKALQLNWKSGERTVIGGEL
jgi:hypothetical protein